MASRAPKPLPYRPRHRRSWLRRHDRRRAQPVPTVAAMLTVFPVLRRTELERIAHRAIDRMDEIDGDPDLEWSGDEFDTGNSEDQQLPLVEPDAIPLSGDSPKGGRQAQDASYLSPILLEIERRLRATGMSASRFGRLSVNDPRLVHDLRRGRDPSSRIVARVRAFMAKDASEKR